MGVLGERDRELADSGNALAALGQRTADEEARHASVTARLNHRMARLGLIERQMVDGERALQKVGVQAQQAGERLSAAEALLAERQAERGQLELAVAEAGRDLGRQGVELARTDQQLAAAQAELATVSGALEHAVLAQDVTSLRAEQATLTDQVAALDQEIEQKGPLAESALSLNMRVAELEQQLLDLTRERDQTALALRQTEAELSLAESDRERAQGEYQQLADQVVELRGQKAAVETDLAALNAEVRHQDSVFATLEVLKKEQDFLRGLIGTMVVEGQGAREQVDQLRVESAALLTQRLEIEKDLIGKQAQIELLDKSILAKGGTLEADGDVSSARAF
jgi:chromosome segregation protein